MPEDTSQNSAIVIAHEADGLGGQITRHLTSRGLRVDTHIVTPKTDKPNEATPFPEFADYDIVVLMGSIRSLTNKDEIDSWVYDELDRIRAAQEAQQPILGICFGGQLIAEALGGSVEPSDTEIGWYEIEPQADHEQKPDQPGVGPWMEWHHDRFDPPPGAEVLATTPAAVQLFTIGRTVGTQFHPEVDYNHVAHWLSTADDVYLDEWGQDRDEVLAAVKANEARNIEQCQKLVDWFLDDVAVRPLAGTEATAAN